MDFTIKTILIFLVALAPLAFGAIDLWAYSVMELGIISVILLAVGRELWTQRPRPSSGLLGTTSSHSARHSTKTFFTSIGVPVVLLSFFLFLITFQMYPLPGSVLNFFSPKSYEMRRLLFSAHPLLASTKFELSFFPLATKIEWLKWVTLSGLFVFLLIWRPRRERRNPFIPIIVAIFVVALCESLYGMIEFFSGRRQILHVEGQEWVSSVTGTFVNRNQLAGFLVTAIPLSIGLFYSREVFSRGRLLSWRSRLASLDGKTLLIFFCIVVMMLALIFSASRMGISSLLLSVGAISLFFRDKRRKRVSLRSLIAFVLSLVWALGIGLDPVMMRFLGSGEDFKMRWAMWKDTARIIMDYPLLGTGLGTFTQIYPLYRSLHLYGTATHAENDFLQLASEVGLLGTGVLSILFLYLFSKAVSGLRDLSPRTPDRYVGMGGLVGGVALMFHSMVERNIQVPANALLFTLIWGIVLRIAWPLRHSNLGVEKRVEAIQSLSKAGPA